MVFLHIVLRNFPLVFLPLLLQEIRDILFLQEGVPTIFLIREDRLHCTGVPSFAPIRRFCSHSLHLLRDGCAGKAGEEQLVDSPYGSRFLLIDNKTFIVAEEVREGHGCFAMRKALPLAPCCIFRDAPAFLLGEAGHDGDQKFALGIHRPDVFLLKINLRPAILQLPNGSQAVHSVPSEAADGLHYCDKFNTMTKM